MAVMNGILRICKSFSQKKRIICDSLVHAIIKIAVACCDKKAFELYDKKIISLAIACISALLGEV